MDENGPSSLYEERFEQMGSTQTQNFTFRTARFLNPVAQNVTQAAPVSIPKPQDHWKQLFKGWNYPLSKWAEWVDRMAGKYSSIWVQAGILDGIMSSIYEITCNHDLISGLLQSWCPKTNTFVFPWGEATVTLEDVMILGGYPVIGDSLHSLALTDDLGKMVEEFNGFRLEMVKSKSKKATHCGWIKLFMGKENKYEHMAFLSLWLSRFVFPSPAPQTMGSHVFPIAAKLSKGVKFALAPAILASIYGNLRKLKEQPINSLNCINLLGPFQLVQLWVYERFPIAAPKYPNELRLGEQRAGRWDALNSNLSLPLLRQVFSNSENFLWRPYAADLSNWRHPSYFQESEQMVSDCSSLDEDFRSFFQCVQPCELIGLGCKEKYLPHRVAMQFGFDQDVPADFSTQKLLGEFVKLFIPSRSFHPGVSRRYSEWWKRLMISLEDAAALATKNSLAETSLRLSDASLLGEAIGNVETFGVQGTSVNSDDPMISLQVLPKSNSGESACSIIPETCNKNQLLLTWVHNADEYKEPTSGAILPMEVQAKTYMEEDDGKENCGLVCVHPRRKNLEETVMDGFADILMGLKNICNATKRKMSSLKVSCVADQQNKKRMVNGTDDVPRQTEAKGESLSNHQLDLVELSDGDEQECKESVKSVAKKEDKRNVGESFSNPIDVDDYLGSCGVQFQKSLRRGGATAEKHKTQTPALVILD